MSGRIRVEVIQAWPRRHESICVDLPAGATVVEAIMAADLTPGAHTGLAVHGEIATGDQPLQDGDRVELLRSLTIDPKEARRRRAGK
jgi:putative ubiquitin-RnfH superfamily antitoxin RatB of RatAB toxin-antitoxin module